MVLVGLIFAIVQYTFILSFKYGCPSHLAPFAYTFVVASGLIGWWFWHQVPSLLAWIGIVLIVVGGLLIIFLEKEKEPSVRS